MTRGEADRQHEVVEAEPERTRPIDLVALLERTFEPDALDDLLGGHGGLVAPSLWEQALLGPARDFLARPGKAFRAGLVASGYALAGGRGDVPPVLPTLIELIHAGSLIVDDIEDGSTHRRGLPALHVRHGLPVALNTGNWMYFLPSALLERAGFPPAVELALHRALDRTLVRCHHGQALDLSVRVWESPRRELPALVDGIARLKTGSLVELALRLGAIAAGATPEREAALAGFGMALGIGLQRLDDLGGLGSSRDPHKRYEDLRLGRPTWPWAVVARGHATDDEYDRLLRRAKAIYVEDDSDDDDDDDGRARGAGTLDAAPLAATLRRHIGDVAKKEVRASIGRALDELGHALGDRAATRHLAAEIDRLERAYG